MDAYLQKLYMRILCDITNKVRGYAQSEFTSCSAGLHKLVQKIKDQSSITLNFNEDGRLHSQYLGDRYEPAIIAHYHGHSAYYYLFDGEIKDCIHPFSIQIDTLANYILYYSSERIERELPIDIIEYEFEVVETYNRYELGPLIEGYKHGKVEIAITDYPKQDYFLHDRMEPLMPFKFSD